MSSGDSERKKRVAAIAVCSFLLVAMVVAVTVGVSLNNEDGDDATSSGSKHSQISSSVKAIKDICAPTDYKKTCEENLRKEADGTTDTKELIQAAFKVAIKFVEQAAKNSTTLQELEKDNMTRQALGVCKQLMNFSMNELEKSIKSIGKFDFSKAEKMLMDLKTWLSATIANQYTCLDGFHNTTTGAGEKMKKALKTAIELSKNGLAIISDMSTMIANLQIDEGAHRRLLGTDLPVMGHSGENFFANWFEKPQFRRLLGNGRHRVTHVKPNVVVAKDGSGKYTTINEALKDIPKNNAKTFVIYVKEGIYEERIIFDYGMNHVVLIGDGAYKTRIRGHLNVADGTNTFNTAPVAVYADYFFAKNIGFENYAGAIKYQAVALLVLSDFSIFYNCTIDGYQDTLYVHSKRQFYRDCIITGTIDFVFGDAAAVFQNCKFLLRKPLDKQQNIVAAHNKQEERENTGLVFQNCSIEAHPEYVPFKTKMPSYLARPWAAYAKTIIMESYIDDSIVPEGWAPWNGTFGMNTCYFSEYNNYGPGANTAHRAAWQGVKTITPEQALEYCPSRFILGDTWVTSMHVPYNPGVFGKKVKASLPPAASSRA
ncbi:hypothetical protein SLEP1_g40650 [Rubroshorea leprosula]|uniref:Pectinesterase n=1 Tax=Rubroshorea leprosula TaxID=152421 RepID=A0AAV5L4N4_9ROSI|nr:hypothetical protein SLEP1_g40650 [Rubroshorea leprosula]